MEHKQQPFLKTKKYFYLPGLTGLYLHTLLRDIGRSLVSIFLPIYVYKLTGNLILPFLLYAVYHLAVVLTAVWVPRVINKIGLDWSAAIGAFLRVVVLLLALKADKNIALLGPAYVFWGVLIIFTWIPHHYNILHVDGGDHKFGKKSSFVLIIQNFANAITPLVGGLIILGLGFNSLYKAAIVFMILSALPLFLDQIKKKDMRFSLDQLAKDLKSKKLRKLNLGMLGEGLEGNSLAVLWPLFIFINLGQPHKVGIVTSSALIVSLIALYILGKHTDKNGKSWAKVFYLLLIVIWLVKPIFKHIAGFIIIDSIYYFSVSMLFLSYLSFIYEFATVRHKMEFLVRREILYHGAGFISSLTMALGIYLFNFWQLGFVLAALGVLLMKKAVFGGKTNG